VRSKTTGSQLNLPRGTKNRKGNENSTKTETRTCGEETVTVKSVDSWSQPWGGSETMAEIGKDCEEGTAGFTRTAGGDTPSALTACSCGARNMVDSVARSLCNVSLHLLLFRFISVSNFRTNKREVQRCFSVCIVQRPSEILQGISSATDRWRRCIS